MKLNNKIEIFNNDNEVSIKSVDLVEIIKIRYPWILEHFHDKVALKKATSRRYISLYVPYESDDGYNRNVPHTDVAKLPQKPAEKEK